MQEKQLDLKLIEMFNTPICKMDGKDLVYLIKGVLSEQIKQPTSESQKEEKHFVYGVKGIAQLFGCSKSTAARIKNSGVINDAITQVGRKIIVDAEKALALIKERNGSVLKWDKSDYIATFSVRNSRNNLNYEISTDSDRKSIVLATGKRARKWTFSPFLNQEKVDPHAL